MKLKNIIIAVVVAIVAVLIYFFSGSPKKDIEQLKTNVQEGEFEIVVITTGELQAKNSEKITGPRALQTNRRLRFGDIKIKDLVPEGTVVDSGQYVAELDKSDADNRLKDLDDELQKIESQFIKIQLDTTMRMRELRDQLVNLKYDLEEKQIVVEQSIYEPPATQRQAKINYEKAERTYNQSIKNYKLKEEQSEADMKEISINKRRFNRRIKDMMDVLEEFVITAPKSGMVIYEKEWGGQKREVGSTINAWDLTVATLPDLSAMISKTYVNEIDISKIQIGQNVKVGVDAFPEKEFTGIITEVANMGEQLANTDAKVFEVSISINQSDSILRPAMTTSNNILIKSFEKVKSLPLVAVHSNDTITFVYVKRNKRKQIKIGENNGNRIIVEKGLEVGEEVYLSVPEDGDKWDYVFLPKSENKYNSVN